MAPLYGMVDYASGQPLYDPGTTGNTCFLCNLPYTVEDLRTIVVKRNDVEKSYFYRVHKSCHHKLGEGADKVIDEIIWTLIGIEKDALINLTRPI
jgi:hypothetical protein